MFRILVPTDFSTCADDALDAAIKIANRLNAEIHIYHSAALPNDWEDIPVEDKIKDSINRSIALMARNRLTIRQEKVESAGIIGHIHYTGGELIDNIHEILEKVDFDLIVMGSHGVSGKRQWFIGSNTQKVVRKFHKNVLVIKETVSSEIFKRVVFVSGLDKKDQDSFRRFLEFIEPFEIEELHILAVNVSGFFSQPAILMREALKDFEAIAQGFNCSSTFYPDYSVEAGLRHFTKDKNLDLVGISNKSRHPLKRIFLGSNVELIVNHSTVPVLSLDNQ